MRGLPANPEGDRLVVKIPATLPFFAGHFPGQPVVPGAALLQLALQHAGLAGTECVELQRVRFLHPVGPDTELTLSFTRTAEGITFRFAVAGEEVACGTVRPAVPR